MDSEYDKLVSERNEMKRIVDTGRKGTVYHTQAINRYSIAKDKIKTLFRDKHNNECKTL